MSKIKIFAMAAAIAISLASPAAFADCASDVKDIENRITGIDSRADNLIEVLEKMVVKAKEALAENNKKKCAKIVEKAHGLLAKYTF